MMPFATVNGKKVYDFGNKYPNHLLDPDPDVYDWKGPAPFSEPETQLIRDIFNKYNIVAFADWHTMNPWQNNNASYTSNKTNRSEMIDLIDQGITAVNKRHSEYKNKIPQCNHIVIEEYDGGNAPFAVNWAQNVKGVQSFDWETGTNYPQEFWTDAYMEMFYRFIYWTQKE